MVVQKDGNILVEYDNARTLVETHLKGLEIIKKKIEKKSSRLKKQKVKEGVVEIHTCLRSSVKAFDFKEEDYTSLKKAFPQAKITSHDSYGSLKKSGEKASIKLHKKQFKDKKGEMLT